MCYSFNSVITHPFIPSDIFQCVIDTDVENKRTLPAWSLGRLVEIIKNATLKLLKVKYGEKNLKSLFFICLLGHQTICLKTLYR